MAIRSAERFEQQATRNILHHKSPELKDVIKKLRLYHGIKPVQTLLREQLLIDLHDSVRDWQRKHPKEFAARHGQELLNETEQEVASNAPEDIALHDGDVLFRWVPKGIDQRGPLQAVISGGQGLQDDAHRGKGLPGFSTEVSALVVQHVGVFWENNVIEIGGGGLEHNSVRTREHYDLVVRSRSHGHSIGLAAAMARVDWKRRRGTPIDFIPGKQKPHDLVT